MPLELLLRQTPKLPLKKAGFAHFSVLYNGTRSYFSKHTLQSPGGSHNPHPLLSTPSNQWLDWLFHKRSSWSISICILLLVYCVELCFPFNIMHEIATVKKTQTNHKSFSKYNKYHFNACTFPPLHLPWPEVLVTALCFFHKDVLS